jgi:hypothetical protein
MKGMGPSELDEKYVKLPELTLRKMPDIKT